MMVDKITIDVIMAEIRDITVILEGKNNLKFEKGNFHDCIGEYMERGRAYNIIKIPPNNMIEIVKNIFGDTSKYYIALKELQKNQKAQYPLAK